MGEYVFSEYSFLYGNYGPDVRAIICLVNPELMAATQGDARCIFFLREGADGLAPSPCKEKSMNLPISRFLDVIGLLHSEIHVKGNELMFWSGMGEGEWCCIASRDFLHLFYDFGQLGTGLPIGLPIIPPEDW